MIAPDFLAFVLVLLGGCTSAVGATPVQAHSQAIHARCVARGLLPDPSRTCTPGAVQTTDMAIICGTSTRERRHVSEAMRRAVLKAYGVAWEDRGRYELDHLVSIEVGGANAAANLWPEPLDDARRKDVVENRLHHLVCSGAMTVAAAQSAEARDWTNIPK